MAKGKIYKNGIPYSSGINIINETYDDTEIKEVLESKISVEEFNEKIFNETEFIEQKTDIFSCDYINSTSEPTIEYTECYLDRSIGVLYMDITITFDTAESLTARKLTILDSDCCWDISRIEDYTLTFYDVETDSEWGTDNLTSTTTSVSSDQIIFGGNSSISLSYRVVGSIPVVAEIISPSIQEQLNECINSVELTDDGLKMSNVLGEENIVVPKSSYKNGLGLVSTTSSVLSTSSYHQPCPIVDGVPYYEKHVYEGMLTLNGSNSVGAYASDTTANTITISLPVGNDYPYKKVYNVYLYHMSSVASSSAPCGYSHLTLFPNILAYPNYTYISYINKTQSTSGGAVLTDSNFTVSGHSTDQEYIDFTISGVSGWKSNLFYKVVVD